VSGIRRIAIVNRGEAAMRLIHAVRELNGSDGRSISTIALHTDGERHAMFVREADEAYNLGPASARPYLDHTVLERALVRTRADAAWVGWGFVAEDPAFADLCDSLGVVFVGPPAEAMRLLGDKITAKRLAEKAGVPVAAWSDGPVENLDDARAHADRIGYPVMLKAAAGGGGRGIRLITSEAELATVFDRTREEALRAFGSDAVFLERLVTGARHIEVQLVADGQGTAWALGVRDCSVQRRNQKLIEESASPVLSTEQVHELKEAACRLAVAVGYRGAGTAEFLYQPDERAFSFLEVNTRLQVEHPVTEATTGADLVRLQLLVAAGEKLEGEPPAETGHAIEARLNAEDPDRDFAPAPGRIALLRLPVGPGVRVDTGVAEGDVIPADFDSMIAKIIAVGATRDDALARLRRALADTTVVIEAGTTNKAFLLDLLDQQEVVRATADTGWIDRVRATGALVSHRHAGIALVAAAIDAYETEEQVERLRFLVTAHGGRPQARHEVGRRFELKLRGTVHRLDIAQVGPTRYRVGVNGHVVDAEREDLGQFRARLTVAGQQFRVVTATHTAGHLVEVGATVHRISRDEGGVVRAPAPALVVALPVAPGGQVAAGAPVAVLESMKMETVLPAPFAGRLRELLVGPNDQVGTGQALLKLEPLGNGNGDARITPAQASPVPLDLPEPPPAAGPADQVRAAIGDLGSLLLGFDLSPEDGRRALAAYRSAVAELDEHDPTLLRAELGVLTVFADLSELIRNRPLAEESPDDRLHSPREFFHSYLHSLDVEREPLPQDFRDKLARMLAHYGVTSLDRGPELEEAVFRVFLSQQRAPLQVPTVSALLERWLKVAPPRSALAQRAYEVLDRLVLAAQLRFPSVGDLARSVRYRWFEAPVVEAARTAAYATVREQLRYLAAHPEAPDHEARIESLVASPEPVVRFLAERIAGDLPEQEPLLEVLARRHYREHTLDDLRTRTVSGLPLVTARYTLDDRPTFLVSTIASMADLQRAATVIESALDQAPSGYQGVVDLYLAWPQAPTAIEGTATALREVLSGLAFARRVRRVAVAVSCGEGDVVQQVTFRPAPTNTGSTGTDGTGTDSTDTDGTGTNGTGTNGTGTNGTGTNGTGTDSTDTDGTGTDSTDTDGTGTDSTDTDSTGTNNTGTDGAPAEVVEDELVRGLHPMVGRWLDLWRLRDFRISRVDAPDDILLYRCVAPENEADVRLVALAQVRELTIVRDRAGHVASLPQAERAIAGCLEALRRARSAAGSQRLDMNHIWLHIWPVLEAPVQELTALKRTIAPLTHGVGLQEVTAQGRVLERPGDEPQAICARFSYRSGTGVVTTVSGPPTQRLQPLDDYAQKVLRSRRRGTVYPYELIPLLTRTVGEFVEHDLDGDGRLVPVDRSPGGNRAGVVVGVVRTPTDRYPEGITRVALLGDPTKALGAVSEAECARIVAAIDHAESLGVPVEWFAISSGARISMDNGTENMDWVARALRRIITFTQGGGEINVVVTGINVGAQPYWNAEATMLLHTKGILVMTPDSAMVLTGKQSLDYSGGVSAEDNFGIGGYDRVMGPNGQAQYWAPDLPGAVEVLFSHYEHAYVPPGERIPRPVPTTDPFDRDVCEYPHTSADSDFRTVGDIFSLQTNPERKKPFDIRTLMRSVSDADHPMLERWAGMAEAETSVVADAHLGGFPVCLLGIESRPMARRGFPPSDGPDTWTAGTLFPRSSKKTARAINAASGSRPLVVLANLSGFDGSPESMRTLQLEYGAEIGRAVVNFAGPIVFCVVSRYHGGAFVVFSKTLHDNMQVLAVEGSYASVIGGAPAAAVVFSGEVEARTSRDPRVRALERQLAEADDLERARLRAELAELRAAVRSEKLGEVAAEFDGVHSIDRAVKVGSVDAVISSRELRPRLIEAVRVGLEHAHPGMALPLPSTPGS
jgi:acetyl/propionyl-CoA carboxylase alpha subunit/acetyl-CoA carboxylase carboxyltransferase component